MRLGIGDEEVKGDVDPPEGEEKTCGLDWMLVCWKGSLGGFVCGL